MKKRGILLGLALAGLFAFSLSSCSGDNSKTPSNNTPSTGENDGGNTVTQKYSITYHTTHGTAPAAVANVTKLPTTLPTLTDDEYDFMGWSATENGNDVVTAGATISKNTDLYAVWLAKARFTATYHTAYGTAPETLNNVKALPDTLPTLTDDNYNFGGWSATENGTEALTAGTSITANADLYAIWTEKTTYEKIVSSTNKVLSYDFNSATTVEKVDTLSFDSTAPTIKRNSHSIKVNNGVLTFGDVTASAIIDFGANLEASAIYSIYFEVKFTNAKANDGSFFELNGKTGSAYSNVFELRNNVAKLAYNAEGNGNTDTSINTPGGTLLKVLIELDTADSKLVVTANGTKIYDAGTNIIGINGLKFIQNTAVCKFDIDNVAVAYVEKTSA